jgi:hypothetical protein
MPIGGIEFHKVSTDEWVGAELRDPADEDGLRLRGAGHDGSGYLTVMYADIPGGSWNPQRLEKFRQRAQDFIDKRIPLDDPSLVDDPAGENGTDPALPWFFWDSGDLVARPVIIGEVTWDDPAAGGGGLNFSLRRVRKQFY